MSGSRPVCCGNIMAKWSKTSFGKQRYRCRLCGTTTTGENSEELVENEPYDTNMAADNYERIANTKKKKFVITCAQNNTRINLPFFESLKTYCEKNKAELIVIPVHHKNISLYNTSQEYHKHWDYRLHPYIVDQEVYLGGNVSLRADLRIGATSLNPLQGKQPIGGQRWTIFGHPQFAMEPVASPIGNLPKRMYTTGSLTIKNYSQTDLGARAAFHHISGALVIEVVDNDFAFIRNLNADSRGRFYDLDVYYDGKQATKGQMISVLTTGDEHVKFNTVEEATYTGKNSLVKKLKPNFIVRHDVLDGYAGSHHHEFDDVLQFKKFHLKDDNYRDELDEVVDFINRTTPRGSKTLIVDSNHHNHLYKWLSRVDPKKDPINALLIHELKNAQYQNALDGKTTDPLEIYLTPRLKCKFEFLSRDEPHTINGVDYSQHGDVGVNGSRGSASALAKTTYKLVIGHSHGARIVKGVYQVGTSTGKLEYEKGLGDHSNTHCIQYNNGKRTLIDIYKGKWKL